MYVSINTKDRINVEVIGSEEEPITVVELGSLNIYLTKEQLEELSFLLFAVSNSFDKTRV